MREKREENSFRKFGKKSYAVPEMEMMYLDCKDIQTEDSTGDELPFIPAKKDFGM